VGSEPCSRPDEEGNGGHGRLVLQCFGVAESGEAVDRGVQEDIAGLRAPLLVRATALSWALPLP
jgi:hypothetical protein